jgi:stearoyl-CoA desaturase (delta-9 desaturase)
MSILDHCLETPSYGWSRDGELYKPSHRELFREFFSRINLFKSRKNWLGFLGWASICLFAIPFAIFLRYYVTLPLFIVGFLYSMVVLGTHGTIYFHRYCTHRAYQFSHPFWRFIVRNMVVKIIPEEIYVISHHVHHMKPEKPGDPYNVHAGWLYCFLADAIHQPINTHLSPEEYQQVARLMDHTGVHLNSYAQYQKWGSICHPVWTLLHFALNWAFWYAFFYWLGGHPLAITIFAASGFWAVGIRTYNYDGHGGGKDKRKATDFNRKDLSINQLWPGLVTGEWHNNHHLYPNGARAGFLPYQWDYAWWFIKFYYAIGAISSYRDFKKDFVEKYYQPYLNGLAARRSQSSPAVGETALAYNPAGAELPK